MRSQRHSGGGEDHGIDLAPMLDFVLNLLIFFIITTSFVREPGITVSKPEAATAVQEANGNILIALGVVHLAAVAVHMLLWRDGLLGRMWFGQRWR